MILIIGGAYQGKRQYASENYPGKEIIPKLHLAALEMLRNGDDPVEYFKNHISDYMDKVIICDDIFCGVVPVEPEMRKWRETLGRTLAFLSKESDQVVRVFCGLGIRIK